MIFCPLFNTQLIAQISSMANETPIQMMNLRKVEDFNGTKIFLIEMSIRACIVSVFLFLYIGDIQQFRIGQMRQLNDDYFEKSHIFRICDTSNCMVSQYNLKK